MALHQEHQDLKKYPAVGPQDEDTISRGIKKAETGVEPDPDSFSEDDEKAITSDDSQFHPTRILYILKHNLFSKEINVVDISSSLPLPQSGSEITNEVRDAARSLVETDTSSGVTCIYRLVAKHWYSSERTMFDVPSSTELAVWKHGAASFSEAHLTFPSMSTHLAHDITMVPSKWYKRTNEWVQDSIAYSWSCDSRRKANRMTLLKKVGSKQMVVARYAQRWGSWITGGVLFIDAKEVDEVVAVLTACVMLRRMQQRAAERASFAGGGGGGGGGE